MIIPNLLNRNSRDVLLARLRAVLKRAKSDVRVEFFGSTVNNLGLNSADADLTIVDEGQTPSALQNMYKLGEILRKAGYREIVVIARARVPICKFIDPNFRNLPCDLNHGHSLGIYNSEVMSNINASY